jgi:hypothetical protein
VPHRRINALKQNGIQRPVSWKGLPRKLSVHEAVMAFFLLVLIAPFLHRLFDRAEKIYQMALQQSVITNWRFS